MLTVAVELRGAPFFGWIQDLSQTDPFYITAPGDGRDDVRPAEDGDEQDQGSEQQQQQKIMMFMPFLFTWICLQMPSGLVLYWFVNNLLGIGQQWLVNRKTNQPAVAGKKAR